MEVWTRYKCPRCNYEWQEDHGGSSELTIKCCSDECAAIYFQDTPEKKRKRKFPMPKWADFLKTETKT